MRDQANNKRITKRRLRQTAVILSAAALLAVGGIMAYFTDTDMRENVVTVGSVKVQLDEGDNYVDSQTAVPGTVIEKAPKLTNKGNNNEYVFLKVEVPKENVTLLYEKSDDPDNEGKIKLEKSRQQIFKLIADGTGTAAVPAAEGKDVVFDYHGNTETSDGWVLLTEKCDFTGTAKDVYVFGYSRMLTPVGDTSSTKTLFDKVQLKSIIDGEIPGSTAEKITVTGYAIQDRNLDVEGLSADTDPTAEQLTAIYGIVERKKQQ